MNARTSFYRYELSELQEIFRKNALPESGPALLYNWHYKKRKFEACEKDLAKVSREFVARHFNFTLPEIDVVKESSDKTVKFLMKLHDGLRVEAVLIPFNNKYTICISSQVGCAMK